MVSSWGMMRRPVRVGLGDHRELHEPDEEVLVMLVCVAAYDYPLIHSVGPDLAAACLGRDLVLIQELGYQ